MYLSMLSPTQYEESGDLVGIDLAGNQIPHSGEDSSQNLIPSFFFSSTQQLVLGVVGKGSPSSPGKKNSFLMHANERIWHLVQIASQISQPSGKIPSSNPHLKPDIACTWGVGLDIDRCITFRAH